MLELAILKATAINIEHVAEILKKGGLAVYPTDTVYGLGCDPFNINAVRRVCSVKGSRKKPLPILSCSLEDVERVVALSPTARRIVEIFWPGPLTLVLPRKDVLESTAFGYGSIGIRIPNSDVALKLIELSGGLLVGTSANKTGRQPPTTAIDAYIQLKDEVDTVLDGGKTNIGVSSTVIDVTGERPQILRKGSVSFTDVLEIFEEEI